MTKQALNSQTESKAASGKHALELRMVAEKDGETRPYLLKCHSVF